MISQRVIEQYASEHGLSFMEAKYQLWVARVSEISQDFTPRGKQQMKAALSMVQGLYDFHYNQTRTQDEYGNPNPTV